MGTIETNVAFAAAPERVWAVASDPSRFGEWLGLHERWQGDVPAEFAPGTRVTAVVSLLNMPGTITWTVDEYEAPRRVALSGTGLAGVKVALTLDVEAHGDGAQMSITADFEGQLVSGAIGQAIERAGRQELDSSLAKLGALVAGPPDGPTGRSGPARPRGR